MEPSLLFTVAIPTYQREQVLVSTVDQMLRLPDAPNEILILDQTVEHLRDTSDQLERWHRDGMIRWIRLPSPSITAAMNRGLIEARGDVVCFVDDDVLPDENLFRALRSAYAKYPEAWAVVGQVVQPEMHKPVSQRAALKHGGLRSGLDFDFSGNEPAWVDNVMAGNLSVRREKALMVGGFDRNFVPPVSYRFETEFAKRMVKAGGKIRFEPNALVHHLRAPSGGTRSIGRHLSSPSPLHGVGDYYYALRCGRGIDRLWYMLKRPFREVRTKFHMKHPWFIPVKFIGECRAMWLALRLYRRGPRLLNYQGERAES